ncbi:MAG: type II secretion system F family protein [Atopobium sp.]|uniref:type II secretion system F family protein n=1 Tax=Atopobium sp. TaxID=1872650 RepID=UPI002A74B42E|nr:type II secretion system F family protein [Atopobium sp.]MDY2788849.1 type II secretion system F family protein [Atopobium sp.]
MDTIVIFIIVVCVLLLGYCAYLLHASNTIAERLEEIENSDNDNYAQRPTDKKTERKQLRLNIQVSERLKEEIRNSGIQVRVEEFLLFWITLSFAVGILSMLLTRNLPMSALATLAASAMPPLGLRVARAQRLAKFGLQLYDAVMLLSNGLRAGFSFEQALSSVATDMPDPIGGEFARAVAEMRLGTPLEDALEGICDRTNNGDMRLMTSAVMVQRRVGGNLSQILDNIATTIRDRVRLRNKINALTAQGRMSGIIIGVLPAAMYFIISAMNPDYMKAFFTSALGIALLLGCVVLELVAFVLIRKITTI